jgi:hypothetical protein
MLLVNIANCKAAGMWIAPLMMSCCEFRRSEAGRDADRRIGIVNRERLPEKKLSPYEVEPVCPAYRRRAQALLLSIACEITTETRMARRCTENVSADLCICFVSPW